MRSRQAEGSPRDQRSRIISVEQVIGIDPIISFFLENHMTISKPDPNGEIWVNRAYYIGKEMSEVDGRWVVHN